MKEKDPRVKELPESVKEMVDEGSKEVESTGNGSCLIGTTALHITGDEEQNQLIASDTNTHIAFNREYYLDKIAADFPITVKIGTNGRTKRFEKGEEDIYFDWLLENKDALYMWRGCVDIIALSNLYQMNVDCIVYLEGTTPEVKHFCPDPEFPWKEDDMMRPNPSHKTFPKMTILNYKDLHFNLVVEKTSMIAQSGTFSFQRKTFNNSTKESTTDNKSGEELKERVKTLERELAKSQHENQILKEQIGSKPRLASKTDESDSRSKCGECQLIVKNEEELKHHIYTSHFSFNFKCPDCDKGFNQKRNLLDHKESHQPKDDSVYKCMLCQINFKKQCLLTDHTDKQHPKETHPKLKCTKCSRNFETEETLNEHEDSHIKNDKQYNCEECDHQTNDQARLEKHFEIAHSQTGKINDQNVNFKFVSCAQGFRISQA